MRLITTTLVELTPEERAALVRWRGRGARRRLAHKIGVAEHTLARWEQGANKPSVQMYYDWIEALEDG